MDKIKTLSEAIRYGSTFLGECETWLSSKDERGNYTCGCALGTAYLSAVDREGHPGHTDGIIVALEKRFGVPRDILNEVSWSHYQGRLNRAQCADWLESKGY